jgi:hypothetical protein
VRDEGNLPLTGSGSGRMLFQVTSLGAREGFKVSVEADPETQAPEPGKCDSGGTLTGPWGLVEEDPD